MPVILPTATEAAHLRPHLAEQARQRAIRAVRDLYNLDDPERVIASLQPAITETMPRFDTVIDEAKWIYARTPRDPNAPSHRVALLEAIGPDPRAWRRKAGT